MISEIALATKSDVLLDLPENKFQFVQFAAKDLDEQHFSSKLFDVVIWEPQFSQSIFPLIIEQYLADNKYVGLVIFNTQDSEPELPELARRHVISVLHEPLDEEHLNTLIQNASLFKQNKLAVLSDSEYLPVDENFRLVGGSSEVKHLNDFISFIAKAERTPCLISGEMGTEKYEIAKLIHRRSQAFPGPFRVVNCADWAPDRLESVLFGREANADQGYGTVRGELEMADGGTIVLENIEAIPEIVQLRLQVFLETGHFRRQNSDRELVVEARAIATTAIDLESHCMLGAFSGDLYFRFKAFELVVPPLRSRKADIIPAANHLVNYYNHKFGRNIKELSPEIEQRLKDYSWPGNFEELRLVLERVVLLENDGKIKPSDLPQPEAKSLISDYEAEFLGNCSLKDIEKMHIERALLRTKGNKSRAAEILNISRTTLREKMRSFNLNS